jgi:hypothetical protein
MRQYPRDDRRIFDAGQHLEFSLASGAAINLNAEHPLQALRPSHSRMAGNGGLLVALSGVLPALAALRRRDGSAQTIAGPVRADLFFGFGAVAGEQAGLMKQDGEMWLLWPKDSPPPR